MVLIGKYRLARRWHSWDHQVSVDWIFRYRQCLHRLKALFFLFSGCGKSTVLGLVQRLYDPSAGRIFVNNKDLRQKNLVQHRKLIGCVTQDCVLFDGTVFDNIVFGWDESEQDESEEEIEARVARAAELANLTDFVRTLPLGFETQVGEGGTQLSGGQKQRLVSVLMPRLLSTVSTASKEIFCFSLNFS